MRKLNEQWRLQRLALRRSSSNEPKISAFQIPFFRRSFDILKLRTLLWGKKRKEKAEIPKAAVHEVGLRQQTVGHERSCPE